MIRKKKKKEKEMQFQGNSRAALEDASAALGAACAWLRYVQRRGQTLNAALEDISQIQRISAYLGDNKAGGFSARCAYYIPLFLCNGVTCDDSLPEEQRLRLMHFPPPSLPLLSLSPILLFSSFSASSPPPLSPFSSGNRRKCIHKTHLYASDGAFYGFS